MTTEVEKEKTEGLDFGEALRLLEAGHAVTRKSWYKAGVFIYLVPAASYPAQTGVAKEFFGENALVPYETYIAMKNTYGRVSVWQPSIDSVLAKDWFKVDIPLEK